MHSSVDAKDAAVEFSFTQNVGDGLVHAAPLYKFSKGSELGSFEQGDGSAASGQLGGACATDDPAAHDDDAERAGSR